MKNNMNLNSRKIIESNNVKYTFEETCPCCGRYTPEGEICTICQKQYNMCEPRVDCREE